MTKQMRMIAYLYKTFDDVIGLGLKGSLRFINNGEKMEIGIILYDNEDELVFTQSIMREQCKYSTFCNRIIDLEKKLRKFGEGYEVG